MTSFKTIAVVLLITGALRVEAQGGLFNYQFEIGTLISVGPNIYRSDSIRINNVIEIIYPFQLRYKHPSLRIRASINYNVNKSFLVGMKSGVTVRYLEPFYDYNLLFSVPLQAKFVYRLKEIKPNIFLSVNLGAGYHFMNIFRYSAREKGGLLYSPGLSINKISSKKTIWSIEMGFERQVDNLKLKIQPHSPHQKVENYNTKTYRNQIYASLGLTLK